MWFIHASYVAFMKGARRCCVAIASANRCCWRSGSPLVAQDDGTRILALRGSTICLKFKQYVNALAPLWFHATHCQREEHAAK
ncbi:hypothetical protein KCP73_03690 [Salmonella enterica subsp. enterica]|nr:hypothetical protein KCP73_03690 [Salmonella enterica subsp. enterica]